MIIAPFIRSSRIKHVICDHCSYQVRSLASVTPLLSKDFPNLFFDHKYLKIRSLCLMAQSQMTTTTTTTDVANEIPLKKFPFMPTKQPKPIFRKDYKSPDYVIKHIAMDFDLGFQKTSILTNLYMYRLNSSNDSPCDLILDGEDLNLVSISLTRGVEQISTDYPRDLEDPGRELAAEDYKILQGDNLGKLCISGSLLPTTTNELFRLTIHVTVSPIENHQLSGLYKSGNILCTQCEAEGFRRITYSLDRPDVLSTYTVRLEAPKEEFPVVLCNGNLVREGESQFVKGKNFVMYEDPFPKPSYLFAIVAGRLSVKKDVFVRMTGKPVQINLWCDPEDLDKLDWALNSIKKSMDWDEKEFGLIYDLDHYNVVSVKNFNAGAMENKSLNIFRSIYVLANQKTATDNDFLNVLSVIGHEYFHNWTGNRVTCRDWFQLTLKEGLTVFREQLFKGEMHSPSTCRIQDVEYLRSRQFNEDAGPLAHPIRPESYVSMDNFYTCTVYEKGAEVIRLYHTLLGPTGFKKGMHLYFKRHDGKAVTCDDFRNAMQDANQYDLTQFEQWYLQKGTPEVIVEELIYDESTMECRMTLSQSNPKCDPEAPPLMIPINIGFIGKESKVDLIGTKMIVLKTKSEQFIFPGIQEPFVLSILRNFSAPIKLINKYYNPKFLMLYDTDPFNRYEGAHRLMSETLIDRIETCEFDLYGNPKSPGKKKLSNVLIEAFKKILKTPTLDRSFAALLLELPSEEILGLQLKRIDPVAVNFARKLMVMELGEELKADFRLVYDDLSNILRSEEYVVTPKQIGMRKLRNLCLKYLTAPDPQNRAQSQIKAELAFEHYDEATNMTDQMAALACLKDLPSPQREEGFQRLYETSDDEDAFITSSSGDHNVISKWFAIQAASDVPTALDDTIRLQSHRDFIRTNADRLNALYGTFSRNLAQFHRLDGKGYEFLAEKIIEIDRYNNQIAARLLNAFSQWSAYSDKRQMLIKHQLNRILNVSNLSKDCQEIVSKLLEG